MTPQTDKIVDEWRKANQMTIAGEVHDTLIRDENIADLKAKLNKHDKEAKAEFTAEVLKIVDSKLCVITKCREDTMSLEWRRIYDEHIFMLKDLKHCLKGFSLAEKEDVSCSAERFHRQRSRATKMSEQGHNVEVSPAKSDTPLPSESSEAPKPKGDEK